MNNGLPTRQSPRTEWDVSRRFADAAAFHQQGRLFDAEALYASILKSEPRHFDAAYRLGLIHLQRGSFDKAEQAFLVAIKIDRKSPDAHHHLAVALNGLNRHADAIRSYRKALKFRPDYTEAHASLGFALQALGNIEDAIFHFRAALRLRPEFPAARNNLGIALQAQGELEPAAAELQKAIDLDPGYAEAHRNLANILGIQERYDEALSHYGSALAIKPDDRDSRMGMGNIFARLGQADNAINAYEELLRTAPEDIEARIALGETLHMSGRSEEAIEQLGRVLANHPDELKAYRAIGGAHHALGNEKEATHAFEKAVSLAPKQAGCFWNLSNSRRVTPDDRHLQTMRSLVKDIDGLDPDEQIDLHFALGKAYSDIGDHTQSFEHILRGNAAVRKQIEYNEMRALQHHERIRSVFTADLIRQKAGSGYQSPAPVFVIGMPRSGTTLIEQILASHPQVHGAGELRELAMIVDDRNVTGGTKYPDWVASMSGIEQSQIGEAYVRATTKRAPSAKLIVDKMPGNFTFAGLIHLALPNAKIIHARRDLRDVAFSCFSILFARGQDFTYDLAELGRYAKSYEVLMQHWADVLPDGAMLDVSYEDLVANLEFHARRIVSYCGLEWDDACLSFYKTRRSVRTASATQVRQPIYNNSIGRWRPHEPMLGPLLEALMKSDTAP